MSYFADFIKTFYRLNMVCCLRISGPVGIKVCCFDRSGSSFLGGLHESLVTEVSTAFRLYRSPTKITTWVSASSGLHHLPTIHVRVRLPHVYGRPIYMTCHSVPGRRRHQLGLSRQAFGPPSQRFQKSSHQATSIRCCRRIHSLSHSSAVRTT